MIRRIAMLLLVGALTLSAAPVRAADGPSQAARDSGFGVLSAESGVNVSGTHWGGTATWKSGESKQWTLYFRPDGVLEYGYDGQHFDNGRWTQNDSLLTFHTNTYFALYAGIVDANTFQGASHNRRGESGSFLFTRTD